MSKPTVLLIDFSNLFWQAWHSNGDAVSMARQRTREAIDRAAGTVAGALVAICCDKGRSFRKDLLDTYKANRPEKDAAVVAEMSRCKESLRAAGYLIWEADGFEADDVIATAALTASDAGHPFCVASADKDLLQLLALPDSSALRTHTWARIEAKDVEAKFGVIPYRLGDWLALVGDASDNIKGAKGVGEKTATTLLQTHGSLAELYAKVDKLTVGTGTGGVPYVETKTPAAREISTPAVVQSLWENRAAVMLARKLVTLRTDAPIRFEDIHQERKAEETTMDDGGLIDGPPVNANAEPAPAEAGAPVTPIRPPAAQSTALTVPGVTYERALEPMSTESAVRLASKMFNSRLFTHYGTEEAVLATMLAGRELGIGAVTSLRAFHNIEGKQAMAAQLITALAERSPDVEYIYPVEWDDKHATWEAKNRRHPKPIRYTYTIEDAERAGLLEVKQGKQPGPWHKRPKDQLNKTAASKLARIVAPGATLGLYCPAELGGDEGEEEAA